MLDEPPINYQSVPDIIINWDLITPAMIAHVRNMLGRYGSYQSSIPIALRTSIKDLQDSHIDSSDQECEICFEKDARTGYKLLPCGHDLICIDCVSRLVTNLCPFCRGEITGVSRI